jgi:hypothetical protein
MDDPSKSFIFLSFAHIIHVLTSIKSSDGYNFVSFIFFFFFWTSNSFPYLNMWIGR